MRRLLLVVVLLTACSSDDNPTTESDASVDSGTADMETMDVGSDAGTTCTVLYGAPNESTGLDSDQCAPSCDCEGRTFDAPAFDANDLDRMRTLTTTTTFEPLVENPYDAPAPETDPGAVCGVRVAGTSYELATYDSESAAAADGAKVTHWGACGLCSTLENFAVYAATTDLTQPVRQCGLDNLEFDGNVACLQDLGFDLPCAQIWAYNTRHTRENCLAECLAALNEPYNLPDGGLNPCLACDETISGPVFKAVAGRTRRNSGLASALCRPCDSVRPVDHRAYLDLE